MVEGGVGFVPVEKRLVSFGRYKGKPLGSLPSGYLRWLASPVSPPQQGHYTIWAQLAKRVLRNRSAFQGLEEQDLEKLTHTEFSSTAPWNKFLHNLDTLKTCVHPATFASLLQWCASSQHLIPGQKAHHHILLHGLEHHPLLRNLIVQMYGDCGALDDGCKHLVALHPQDTLAWNLMMKAYTQHGYINEVLGLYELMLVKEIEPNRVTILNALDVCGKHNLLCKGRLTHHSAINVDHQGDGVVANALITMYGKCGSLDDARDVFEQMPKSDVVTWNALIAAFGQNGLWQLSLSLHMQMKQEGCFPDEITYVSILDACASLSTLLEGRYAHVLVLAMHLESSVVVGTALVNMYGKCGMPDDARQSFEKIPQKNTVCWTAMISAYAQNKCGKDALELFTLMEQEGAHPNRVTFVSVLDACATSANLSLGEKIHERIKNSRFTMDTKVGTTLMNMYGRCGRVDCAKAIFDKLPVRDLASWNAMIAAYAQHGQVKQALQLFDEMKQKRVRPDMITYVSILSMCSRAGLIHEACELFTSMERDYGIASVEHHHNCIVDLLAKAGKLDEAEHLIQDLPEARLSDVPVMTLFGACKNRNDLKGTERMAQLLFRVGRGGKDPSILMAAIRAAHSIHKVARVASESSEVLMKNIQGKCLIRLGGRVHQFRPHEKSHPLLGDICRELTRLTSEMQRAGHFSCIPQKDLEVFDQEEHTGMLAATFGLMSTPPGMPLYITKDTNLCAVCHLVIEFMSKVTSRKIVVKDGSRLHRFQNGSCSCAKWDFA
ncbi:hypothetical protein GOP47_0001183 [Adiantum capillus-veneris]|uniref:DYW domain-containing protein n=1 Tax=Adiantum capillus-veneris TaxID=13818 RepID=A0A9D4ZR90_ADICA|nr:hypothetical protein GOP47_0001183 [Adiantum capillus-veneris]